MSIEIVGGKNPTVKYIQRSMRTLEKGEQKLRVLFYGQSITSQAWRKIVEEDIKKKFPKALVEFKTLSIGGFQSHKLCRTAYHDLYPYYPDLLIFHVYGNSKDFEQIIRKTRRLTSSEIILWTNHVARDASRYKSDERGSEKIIEIAKKYDCMLIDVRTKWKKYLDETGKQAEELLQDTVHLNDDGVELLGKIISADIKRSSEFGENEVYDEQIKILSLDSPMVKISNNGTIRLNCKANRVVAVSVAKSNNSSSILLNGRKPSEYPDQWAVSRPSKGPEIWMPAIKQISFEHILEAEEWTLSCLEKSSLDGEKIYFKIKGSKTGDDGEGVSTEDFVSKSKRVKIKASDWHMAFPIKYRDIKLPEKFKIKWTTYPLSKDEFIPGEKDTETVLIQSTRNRKISLTIKPRDKKSTGIKYFKIYTPAPVKQ